MIFGKIGKGDKAPSGRIAEMQSIIGQLKEHRANLQLIIRHQNQEIEDLKSGEAIKKMRAEFQKELAAKDREIKKYKDEAAQVRADQRRSIASWMKTNDEVDREAEAKVDAAMKEVERLRERCLEAERQRDEALDKCKEERRLRYEAQTKADQLEDEIKALKIRLNKDHTNSNKPSSANPNHGKITNGREPTDRKPGGQPGHPHHPRKPLAPTDTVEIPAPEEYTGDAGRYRPTGNDVRRQVIRFRVNAEVIEYVTPEFIDTKTGKKVHAAFPEGVKDDVNYDATVKAFANILVNKCNVSIGNVKALLKDISHGELDLSTGFICGLSEEFSKKTEEERAEIYEELFRSPVLHADFTFGRVNGKQSAIIITATDTMVLYQGREKKGREGIKGSPVEHYQGILVSDHEFTFALGSQSGHQECMSHVLRHLKGSIENEPDLQWNKLMENWIKDTIHLRNEIRNGNAVYDAATIEQLKEEYSRIIEQAKQEYDYTPPADSCRDGYNLYKRMGSNPEQYQMYLDHKDVSPTNSVCERAARKDKRKEAQIMCHRSQAGLNYYCDYLSIQETILARDGNLMDSIADRFNRTLPKVANVPLEELNGLPLAVWLVPPSESAEGCIPDSEGMPMDGWLEGWPRSLPPESSAGLQPPAWLKDLPPVLLQSGPKYQPVPLSPEAEPR